MTNELISIIRPSSFGNQKKEFNKRVRLKKVNTMFSLFVVTIFSCLINNCACNRPPRFVIEGQSEIVLRLKESPETAVGTLIYRLKGYDPDNDPLTFSKQPSPSSDVIRIENTGSNEAHVYLAKELDRETKDEYSIVLTLTDNHNLGEYSYVTQSFLLLVEDINDNVPVFKPYQSAIEVPENSRPGIVTTLEAVDKDEGAYGQVVYYMEELDGDNDVFSISTYQGKGFLRLSGKLDYETKSLYQLRVLAIDRANQGPVNTGTAAILVKVKDIEDQPPEFIQVQAVARIPEDSAIGSRVLQVKAIDGDRGIDNPIKYTVEKNEQFGIDSNTGYVYTARALDREDTRNQVNGAYILKITATELSEQQPSPSVKTEVTIIITDVDDEIPTFSETIYRCDINENSQVNTPLNFIDNVKNFVFDHDVGNNGTFRLFMDPPNDIFEIVPELAVNEATFLIRVKDPKLIDYEKNKEMNFTLFARGTEDPDKWSSAHLQIYIRDQNDNFPEFTQSVYNVTVLENREVGTMIAHISAHDKDSGDFGTVGIRYKNLRGSIANLLNLDPISGILSIGVEGGEAFDREVISRHYLTVEAQDNIGSGNRNTAQIIINIADVNDNSPLFLQRYYEANLLENKYDFETALVLEARDIDLNGTENSQITYEIVEGMFQRNFTINKESGVLKPKRPFDFESLPAVDNSNIRNVELLVRARDSGIPMLSTVVPVVVYIHDVNDNRPIFQKSFYAKSIPEDLASGNQVLEVRAEDLDGSSPNNNVVYRIQSGAEDKFIVNAETGVIYVANGASLDPDLTKSKKTVYTLTLLALDGGIGSSQLMNTATVNISINDVNNKLPVLGSLPQIKIMENTPVGSEIYRISASDLDENPILRYQINRNNSNARNEDGIYVKLSEYDFISAFDLNAIDGTIKVAKLLDREKVEHVKLSIICEDLGAAKEPQITEAYLNIQIEDENDNNPKFMFPFYKKSIAENSMNGVLVANIIAYDVDKNKTITYTIEGNPVVNNLIHLDGQSGEIVVGSKIDHELYQWLNFSVRATDSGFPARSSLVDVFIKVLDENDNNPYFKLDNNNFTISENAPIGTRIGNIQATDADSGDFGKVTFLIDRISAQGKFSIDADTGVLTVVDKLDREAKDIYMLLIEAWDNYQFGFLAGESRNAFKQITVTVLDENDSVPEVTLPSSCVPITEYHDLNEVISTIHATDSDDPNLPNGRLDMKIANGNSNGLFELRQVDPWTAHLFAKTSLKNQYGNYTLGIQVRDLGTPPNVVRKPIKVCISDFNDHAPVFVSPLHNTTMRLPENTTVGSLIMQVHAIDDDTGPNALVQYRLKSDPMGSYKTFEVEPESGMLYLRKALDREKQKLYEIRIEAFDQGVPTSLTTDLDLTVYVRNVNDYEPQFLVDQIDVNFTEHFDPGNQRIKLPDTIDKDEIDDLDDPPNSVCYFIIQGNEEGYFFLHPESHILMVHKELDRELKANHTLYIQATEDCSGISFNKNPAKSSHIMPMTNRKRYLSSEVSKEYETFKENEDILCDNTVVRVLVHVLDINDNAPQFKSKIFTGGITTSADFGRKIMKLEAYDPDDNENAIVSYYQIGEIRQTLSEGLENVEALPFIVDRETGDIQLNFDPQKGMKGYFDFMVVANDTDGLQDSAHVFIYLLREDQKVRFVFRLQPSELREKIYKFKNTMSDVTKAIVNIDEYKVHENKDGSVDKTKTDLYMHLVDRDDNSILEVTEVLRLIDQHVESLDGLFKEFNVLDTQPAEAQLLIAGQARAPMFVWFVFSNLFLGTLLVVTLALCASQRNGYKRQLRAAKVNIFHQSSMHNIPDGPEPPSTTVPNTNKHSIEGSNPIWLKGYENEWFKNDDDQSQGGDDSLDDNFLSVERQNTFNRDCKILERTNDLNRHFNVYHQIDKLTNNAHSIVKKLETTEL